MSSARFGHSRSGDSRPRKAFGRSGMARKDSKDSAAYDRALAERYWGSERLKLAEEFKIVLSAGEPRYVNAAYHRWETETLVRALGGARGVRVLDLACGLGRVSRVLARAGARVIGVDNALAMLLAARQNLGRHRAKASL